MLARLGALLAFALSFDEIVVTTSTTGAQNTLPLWIFGNIRLAQALPQVNIVVLLVLAVTILRSRWPNADPRHRGRPRRRGQPGLAGADA